MPASWHDSKRLIQTYIRVLGWYNSHKILQIKSRKCFRYDSGSIVSSCSCY